MKHTFTNLITALLLELIAMPLTAHDENRPHKHRYDPDTGSLATTTYYDSTACEATSRAYHVGGAIYRADIYHPGTDKIKQRIFGDIISKNNRVKKIEHYRLDGTLKRLDLHGPNGFVKQSKFYHRDGTLERTEYPDR